MIAESRIATNVGTTALALFTTMILAAACSLAPAPEARGPQVPVPSTPTPVPAASPTPTLPPTLTALPVQAATPSSEPIFQPVIMSAADKAAYERALEDIERYRKGDLRLRLHDARGLPLAGYEITYRQTDHDFWFGTVSDATTADLAKDAGLNGVTVLPQWWLVQPEDGDYELAFANYWAGIDELASLGLRVKTNGMFNPAEDPDYMKSQPFDSYLARLDDHVTTLVRRFAPAVDQWEAILEPNFGNHNPYGWTHDQYMDVIATSIRAIKLNDPTAQVEVNLSYPCGGIGWLDNFAIVEEMLQRNIDFDVLGLQLYYNSYILNPSPYPFTRMSLSEMSSCVDRYQEMLAPHGKSIAGSEICVPAEAPAGVTGYWGHPWSQDLQAQYLTTAYTIFFAKPLNHSLTWWDFQSVPPGGFVYEGGLIDKQQLPKKAYFALKELIHGWTSSGRGATGQDGEFAFRGFAGNYQLLITNPQSGSRMHATVHVAEQTSQDFALEFLPLDELKAPSETLSRLVAYWRGEGDQALTTMGADRLALASYHQARGEVDRARQALMSGLEALAITRTISIPYREFKAAVFQGNGPVLENGWALIWSGSTLYYPENFPAGHARVEVTAMSHPGAGTYPTMTIGIGGHSSPPILVDHPGVYSTELDLTGDEDVFTIRFLYEDNPDPGEFKLFVDKATITIKVTEETN